jgi:hypothetical protein
MELLEITMAQTSTGESPTLNVTFLEVDMSSVGELGCRECDSTRQRLDAAIKVIEPVFRELGIEIQVKRELVKTAQQAQALNFQASPTIQVEGHNLAPEHQADGSRIWTWRGERTTNPPKAMIIDTLLRGYVQSTPVNQPVKAAAQLHPYLQQFLNGTSREAQHSSSSVNSSGSGCTG